MSKVFLSYSHNDKSFVENLYYRLSRDGVDCFYDSESIKWGENFVLELEKGIDECDYIVLVLSPDFLKSEWTKLERTSAMGDDPAGLIQGTDGALYGVTPAGGFGRGTIYQLRTSR